MRKSGLVNPVAALQTSGMAKGTIVTELRTWRVARGLTLEAAGALIIVDGKAADRAMFHAWETGRKTPRPEWIFQIERVTGVQPNAFYARPAPSPANDPAPMPPRQAVML